MCRLPLSIFLSVVCFVACICVSRVCIARAEESLEELTDYIDELEGRVDGVERRVLMDKVSFRVDYRTRIDYYSRRNSTEADGANTHTEDVWSNRFRLNMRAELGRNAVFQGRLSLFHLFNEFGGDAFYQFIDEIRRKPDKEGKVKVERAYIDYFVPDTDLSISIGRLPMSDGPPLGFKDDVSRRGTYPIVLNDGVTDGIVLSYKTDALGLGEKSVLRAGYAKLENYLSSLEGFEWDSARLNALAWETQIGSIDKSLFWVCYFYLSDFAIPAFIPGVEPVGSIADVSELMTHVQVEDIADSGLDYFFSLAWIQNHNRESGVLFPAGTLAPVELEFTLTGSRHRGNLGDTTSDFMYFTGLRYTLPVDFLNESKLGFEFHHSTRNYNIINGGDFINKLSTRGESYELYYVQPVNRYLKLRVGYILMDERYTSPGFGYADRSDEMTHNAYLLADVSS